MPDNSQLDDGDEQILSAADRDLFATITKHLRPGKGTVALNRFIVEHASIVGSFLYTTGLATRVDEMRNIARPRPFGRVRFTRTLDGELHLSGLSPIPSSTQET